MKRTHWTLTPFLYSENEETDDNGLVAPLGNLKDNEENALDNDTNFLYSENEETDDNGLVAPLGNLKDNEENALDNETISLYSENKTWTTMNWPLPWAI
jgi:hypothetical protein